MSYIGELSRYELKIRDDNSHYLETLVVTMQQWLSGHFPKSISLWLKVKHCHNPAKCRPNKFKKLNHIQNVTKTQYIKGQHVQTDELYSASTDNEQKTHFQGEREIVSELMK